MDAVTLTIDGRRITVEAGTTVLEAARRLGIEIPTLCHVEGSSPPRPAFSAASRSREFARSRRRAPCRRPTAWSVTTDSDDIRASRKMALELLLSDHAGDCIAPCSAGCPAGLDVAPTSTRSPAATSTGRWRSSSTGCRLPGTLGRVCPRLCEENCRRCDLRPRGAGHRRAPPLRHRPEPGGGAALSCARPGRPSGKSVAIVGAGPAGLSAAFYLRRTGPRLHPVRRPPAAGRHAALRHPRVPPSQGSALDDEIRVIERSARSSA